MFENDVSLRAAGEKVGITQEIAYEYVRCKEDIIYFAEKYFVIQTIDNGRQLIELWEYQKKLLKAMMEPPNGKRNVIVLSARQNAKTTTTTIYLLHFALFNKETNMAILANKESTAREILDRIKMAYSNLPLWLQQGIEFGGWNKTTIALENGVKLIAASTSSNAIRGLTISQLFLDETAFIPDYIWSDFYKSVLPTMSSGKKSKMIMVSTPNGMNHYYNLWKDAINGVNDFYPIRISWRDNPTRDEEWARKTRMNMLAQDWLQEFECRFIGANDSLIDNEILERTETKQPVEQKYNAAFNIYEKPDPKCFYILGIDPSKGGGADSSVIQVLKINSEKDVDQVATYRANTISPDDFAQVCIGVSKYYNDAEMMIESNDIGELLCNIIWNDYECDKILNCDKKGFGIRATRKTKLAGNLLLKKYVENGWLQINDYRTLHELSRYAEVSPNVFHAVGQNEHDDCVSSLIWGLYYLTTEFYDSDSNGRSNRKNVEKKYLLDEEGPIFLNNDSYDNFINSGDWFN